MKTAFITGVSGQDGSYLARLLLAKGYRVYGSCRPSVSPNFWRLRELGLLGHERLRLVENDLTDLSAVQKLLTSCKPDEIYHLAGQSSVGASIHFPRDTALANATGALNVLEASCKLRDRPRLFQASSAEIFGNSPSSPQNEATPCDPLSPYGIAKLFSQGMTRSYRDTFGLFACSGILFNHESPLRSASFVTRRITQGVAAIAEGAKPPLTLGSLAARRDWGYAADYVEGMWRMLQGETAEDFVFATGRAASVRDFVEMAFAAACLDLRWEGQGEAEVGYERTSGRAMVTVDARLYRSTETSLLVGDSSKAAARLGWQARTQLQGLCAMMVDADIARARNAPPAVAKGLEASNVEALVMTADGRVPQKCV